MTRVLLWFKKQEGEGEGNLNLAAIVPRLPPFLHRSK
ncbi:hypothetical protein NC652_033648 [Populus alba x Populus x berolinensis]|nr:hypothetical protein NC652_033648 [Populus alba x Populus x berolinensis]